MRCEEHGLATGPDGFCVLCRRSTSIGQSSGPTIGMLVVVGLMAVAGLGIVAFAVFSSLRKEVPTQEPVSAAQTAAPSVSAEDPEIEIEATEPELEPSIEEPPPALAQPEIPQPAGQVALAAPAASASAAADAAAKPKAFSQDEIRSAMRRVPVTMYTTNWCRVCDKARGFFRANGISVVEKDVEASPAARNEQRRLNPAGGVPTIKIDEEVFAGFSERELTRMLVSSAVRRLEAQRL